MKIAIGVDHRGFEHKEFIKQHMSEINWEDVGAYDADRSDFPLFTTKVVECVLSKKVEYGVLLCGTGVGMSIAANRYPGIYAALIWNEKVAGLAKTHNNANVLIIPADFVSKEDSVLCIKKWLTESFGNERYEKRIEMIDALK